MNRKWNTPKLWICICLVIATFGVYAQVYRHDFVDFDDGAYVFENWHVTTGLNWQNVSWAFTAGHSGNWHPMTWLSHMLDCQLFGLNPGPQHLVSVFFHVANVLLLFLLLQYLTGALWRSAFVAALFALHPLHVESVAWVAERKDILSTLFGFCTLWMYASYVRKPALHKYLLTIALFALGLMAKPMLVTLPFVLLLLDYWPLNRFAPAPFVATRQSKRITQSLDYGFWRAVQPFVREKIPFFLLAAVSSVITFFVQKAGGAVQSSDLLSLGARIANATHSYVAYLAKMCWPTGLSVYYRIQPASSSIGLSVLASFFLLCITFLVIHFVRRFPYLAVGWFWYLGTLIPVIGIVQVGGQAMADRYTYVPLVGIFIMISWGLSDIAATWIAVRKPLVITSAFLLLVCIITTWHQVRFWRDTISLSAHAVEADGENYMAHQIFATGLAKRNKSMEAIAEFSKAHQLRPSDVHVMGNLGTMFFELGNMNQASELFSEALKIKPDDPIALRNMGRIRFGQGRFDEAADFFGKALRRMPDNFLLYRYLGDALAKLGKNQEAIDAYDSALRIRPLSAEALLGLGTALAGQGKTLDAVRYIEQALQINPKYAQAHILLGTALFQQGQVEKALSQFAEALRLNPRYSEAHYSMGVALNSQGKTLEAIAHYREAIRLRPDYVDAFYNLAGVLDSRGDATSAIANYQEAIRLRPDYVEAYNNLGVTYFKSGQIQKALDAFSQALRVAPDNADARRNRDAILSGAGQSKRIP